MRSPSLQRVQRALPMHDLGLQQQTVATKNALNPKKQPVSRVLHLRHARGLVVRWSNERSFSAMLRVRCRVQTTWCRPTVKWPCHDVVVESVQHLRFPGQQAREHAGIR